MRAIGAAVVCLLLMRMDAAAHRLDEYLQATRVSLARGAVTLEVDLTPGASVAASVLEVLDTDRDGRFSAFEAGAYGRAVVEDLVIELDGRPVALTVDRVEASTPGEMREGMGTIQVHAVGRVDAVSGGRHELYFRNNHRPGGSVYLVNALVSEDRTVSVERQRRDARQQEVRIDYTVGSKWPVPGLWLFAGGAALLVRVGVKRRS
jgi:nickel/cobalt transporter (NicO) family protein